MVLGFGFTSRRAILSSISIRSKTLSPLTYHFLGGRGRGAGLRV